MRPAGLLFAVTFSATVLIDFDALADNQSKPYGMKTRVPWTTSRVAGTPDPPPPYNVTRAFPRLKFKNPVYIVQEPGTNRFLVAELSGKIYAFTKDTPDVDSRELFLDVGRRIFSFSFHPQYEENGYVFVFCPTGPPKSKEKQDPEEQDQPESAKSCVSRFQTNLQQPRHCALDSEKVIIEWPSGGHNGGEAIIGPDGYLYVSTGDSTSDSDPKNTGQGVDDLLSVIMRLDVDNPDPGKPYSIPKDNPFIDYPGARPEIWAFGFRNPWRMSFDAKTGRLWVGDVGQDLWEMIWLVKRGGNYGWSVREGSHLFHPNKKHGPGPILSPIMEHHHTVCRSITGGYVYHGAKFPELRDVYFYGDYEYGQIWGLRYDGQKIIWHQELADTALRIPSFGVSRDGDIYLMDHLNGELYELVRAPTATANSEFPRKLSETGIFASIKDQKVAPGVIPYSVNTPNWSDNATKERFIALPNMSKINFIEKSGDVGTWEFEDGAVNVESISLEMEVGNPASRKRIETRITFKQQNHWLGYTYLWNDEQTDAVLVDAGGLDLTFTIKDPVAPGGKQQQTWHVPSRNECMGCHSRAAGFVLGLNTLQMNKDHDYGDVVDNQLRTLNHIGLFQKPLEKRPDEYDALPNAYDESADLNARARAYLHVNCAVCHASSGGGNARILLGYRLSLEQTKLIDGRPIQGTFGLADARIIAPGDPYASVLFYRLSKLGRGRMPHVGSTLTDERGIDLIHDWIEKLPLILEKEANKEQAKKEEINRGETNKEEKVHLKPPIQPEYATLVKTFRDDKGLSAEQRAKIIAQLLSTTRGAFVLSRLVAQEPVLESVRQEMTAPAIRHPDVNVRDLFERFVPVSQRTKRLGDVINPAAILSLKGNAESGRRFFFSANATQCKNCHRIRGTGGTLGPDLSEVAKKSKRADILESLIEPSKKIEPKYTTYGLATTAGRVLSGILVEKSDKVLVLNVFKEGRSELTRFFVKDVDEIVPQKKSMMPDRLLRDMTAQQAADLLEYLASLK